MTTYNLILNLGGEKWQMDQLEVRKSGDGDKAVEVINLTAEDLKRDPTNEELALFERIDSTARIYIVDHGSPNSSSIMHGHYSEVGDYLAKRISKDKLSSRISKLKISLLSCNSAVGNENSFAGLFHRYLGQQKHLDVDVLARNQVVIVDTNTMTRGVRTIPLVYYAIKKGLWEMGIKSVFQSTDVMAPVHQEPGTKVKFTWDGRGNEYMIDAYVDHFAKMNKNLTSVVFEILKNSKIKDAATIDSVKVHLSKLIKICKSPEQLDEKKIEKIIKILGELKKKAADLEQANEISAKIDEIIEFRNRSISSASLKAKNLHFNIHRPDKGIENPNIFIKRELYGPVTYETRKLPRSEEREKLKKVVVPFLEYLGGIANSRLMTRKSVEREKAISKFMSSALKVTNSKRLSQDEKINEIILLKGQIQKYIEEEVLFSATVKGALEGMDEAVNFGGLTMIQTLFPMISGRSEEEAKIVTELLLKIDAFSCQLIEYISTSGYEGFNPETPEAKLVEEAENIAKVALEPIDKALAATQQLTIALTDPSADTDTILQKRAENQMKANRGLMAEAERRLDKLTFSVVNSPDQRMKEIYIDNCISVIVNELEDLRAATLRTQNLLKGHQEKPH